MKSVEELLKLAELKKEDSNLSAKELTISEDSDIYVYIKSRNISRGVRKVSSLVIYNDYLKYGSNKDKKTKDKFCKEFAKMFERYRTKKERGFLINEDCKIKTEESEAYEKKKEKKQKE